MKDYPYRKVFEVSEHEAMYNLYYQMLVGDLQTDNIMGCGSYKTLVYKSGKKKGQEYTKRVGIGPAKAKKILEGCTTEEEMYEAVWVNYYSYLCTVMGDTEENLAEETDKVITENARLLFMIRELDSEGKPIMWEPPV